MLIVLTVSGLLLIPSLGLLFRVFKARDPQALGAAAYAAMALEFLNS